ncbi:MAG: glycosyltransferase [Streptosporangiales bacterium]|nr:glycosyltransferase [Streptosporangiales bacterium]
MLAPEGMLRVAHFTDTWLPRRDGVVTALQTLTSVMGDVGHSSVVVVPRHHQQAADASTLRLPSVRCGIAQFRLAAWPRERHVDRVAQWAPDLLHVHSPGPIGLLGIVAARTLGLPLVLTYHTDLSAYAQAYRLPPHVLHGVLRCYARRLGMPKPDVVRYRTRQAQRRAVVHAGTQLLYGCADTVLIPTRAILERSGLAGMCPHLQVVPTGVAAPVVQPGARAGFRRRNGIGPDERVALFVGRLNREKGIDLLAAAFARLRQTLPAARLVLVGAAHDERWLRAQLDGAGVTDRTVRTGELPPADVAEAYAAADVFAFPSRTDTQALVIQEAALAGLPSVLADPALHRSGPMSGTALLASGGPDAYAAALARLLSEPALAASLGAAARGRAEQNTPQAYGRRMATVYAETLRRRTSRRIQLSA